MAEDYLAGKQLYRELDASGFVRVLRPAERARPTTAQLPQLAATEFLSEHADELDIRAAWLTGAALGAVEAPEAVATADDLELLFVSEKGQFDTATVVFQQTWRGIPVWRTGATVTMRQAPTRVTGAQSTCYPIIEVHVPQATLAPTVTGARGLTARALALDESPVMATERFLAHNVLSDDKRAHILSNQLVVFRYDAARRFTDERVAVPEPAPEIGAADTESHVTHVHALEFPTEVPQVEGVDDGEFRLAREIVFSLPTPPRGRVVWLAVVDIETRAVLYLRPFTADASGLVFATDPLTQGGAALPGDTAANLNPFRSSVLLPGLSAPAPSADQALTGDLVSVTDFEIFTAAPPTEPSGTNFDFASRTNNFAAVNAYYHCDWFFRLVEDLGFPRATYFDGTTFPVPVDHRGRFLTTDGIEINASCSGNGSGGIANVDFELASLADLANPMGLATDRRVVLHELGGHGILYDHVNAANFGFSHSAGDSFAAVLSDPDSLATDRFLTFPWVAAVIDRRHDRPVGGGWGWGGTKDTGSYSSEQILSTSHFRMYRSLGGASTDLDTRRFAARVTAYLMLRAVGTLSIMTNPSNASQWVQALLDADAGDWTSEGLAGGAYGKVIRWAFEKQGLFQAPGAPTPVTQEGAPPAVDVYIDDGRHGEYQYQPVHWENQNVWNRRFADNGTVHEDPWLGQTNFAYCRVRNRGTITATNVVVRGFHCNPGVGLTWPDDWQAMTTPQLSVADIPPGGEVMVGPFSWTPSQPDHECLLMIASAAGDPSNVDVFQPGESIPEWRLVPHDNNIGQRNVHPVPAAGGVAGITGVLDGRGFVVHNPFDHRVKVVLHTNLPSVLARKGWRVGFSTPGGAAFSLAAGASKQVRVSAIAGDDVSAAEVKATADRDVLVSVRADGILIGGMTYRLDPDRAEPMPQDGKPRTHDDGGPCDDECEQRAKELLRCLNLPSEHVSKVQVRHIGVDIRVDDC